VETVGRLSMGPFCRLSAAYYDYAWQSVLLLFWPIITTMEMHIVPPQLRKEVGKSLCSGILKLRFQRYSSVPDFIPKQTHLESLNLEVNELTDIPHSLSALINLTSLVLSKNKLTSIPEAIFELAQLRHLDMRDNVIQLVPKEIERLVNLNHLDLGVNNISVLPPELGALRG